MPRLPVLPLKNTVVFPRILVPLAVGRPRSLKLIDELPAGDREMAVAAQIDEEIDEARRGDVHNVGTAVRVQHLIKLPDGTVQLAVQGTHRIRLLAAVSDDDYLVADFEDYPEEPDQVEPLEMEALVRSVTASFHELVEKAPYLPGEVLGAALNIDEPLHLAYFIAHYV